MPIRRTDLPRFTVYLVQPKNIQNSLPTQLLKALVEAGKPEERVLDLQVVEAESEQFLPKALPLNDTQVAVIHGSSGQDPIIQYANGQFSSAGKNYQTRIIVYNPISSLAEMSLEKVLAQAKYSRLVKDGILDTANSQEVLLGKLFGLMPFEEEEQTKILAFPERKG